MADFAFLETPKLISRKIWIKEQLWNVQYFWKVKFGHNFAYQSLKLCQKKILYSWTPLIRKSLHNCLKFIFSVLLLSSPYYPLFLLLLTHFHEFLLQEHALVLTSLWNMTTHHEFNPFFWKWDFKKVFIALKRSL